MKHLKLAPIEILTASNGLIALGHRIEDLKARGYTDKDIEQVLNEHKPNTLRLASKFLNELRTVKGKA